MGTAPVSSPDAEFSRRLVEYVRRLAIAGGGQADGDPAQVSGRWAAREIGLRSRSYWDDVFKGQKALNTEDINAVAAWARVSPFELIGAARNVVPFPHTPSEEEATDDLDAVANVTEHEQPTVDPAGPEEGA